MPSWLTFVLIGVIGGVFAGLFGVGGGIVIVPGLIYMAGFSQAKATGTSLAGNTCSPSIRNMVTCISQASPS